MLTISINLTLCIGYACRADKNPYRHDRRADNDPYRHDRRADKNTYRHDCRADSQCHKNMLSFLTILLPIVLNHILK